MIVSFIRSHYLSVLDPLNHNMQVTLSHFVYTFILCNVCVRKRQGPDVALEQINAIKIGSLFLCISNIQRFTIPLKWFVMSEHHESCILWYDYKILHGEARNDIFMHMPAYIIFYQPSYALPCMRGWKLSYSSYSVIVSKSDLSVHVVFGIRWWIGPLFSLDCTAMVQI